VTHRVAPQSPSKNASSRYFAEDQAGTFSERAEVSLGGAIEALLKVGGVEAWHPGTVTQVDHSRRSFRAAFVFEAGAQVLKFSTRLQGSEWRWPLADLNETSEKGKLVIVLTNLFVILLFMTLICFRTKESKRWEWILWIPLKSCLISVPK
jgi:hypothetical protein